MVDERFRKAILRYRPQGKKINRKSGEEMERKQGLIHIRTKKMYR